jgi:hypothetical protein
MRFSTATVFTLCVVLAIAVGIAFSVGERRASGQSPETPAASANVPRTADGKPSLEGIWQALNTAAWDLQDHSGRLGVPAGQGVVEGNEIPYQDWALAKKKENFARRSTLDPEAKCFTPGIPRLTYMPFPFQIAQSPDHILMIYEYVHLHRLVAMDGSPHPDPAVIDFWMGDSRGRWEGDTLVVDVRNFNDQTWFDRAGNFHSDALHVTERFTRLGPDHMTYDATIEDPMVFTRPWKISMPLYRRQEKDVQLLEYECYAYERDNRLETSGTR